MSVTVLGPRYIGADKTLKISAIMELTFQWWTNSTRRDFTI